jgi:acetyl esterase/lipase
MQLPALTAIVVVAAFLGQSVTPASLLEEKAPAADFRIQYGPDPLHVGELRLPKGGTAPHPVAMLVHGGCWMNVLPKLDPRAVTLDLLRPMAAALSAAGIATWNVEYRRLGDTGAGWPGSFEDLSRATDFLRELAPKHRLDLSRIVVAGHSSGGHLALWIAARPKLPPSSALYVKNALPVRAVINLDGPADPAAFQPMETKVCPVPAVTQFLGGTPTDHPDRYRDASSLAFLPLGVPQEFIGGALVRGFRDQIASYQSAAQAKGDVAAIVMLDGAGHFDMLSPGSTHWKTVEARFQALLR